MDIPSNVSSFELSFHMSEKLEQVHSFYASEQAFYEHIESPSVVLTENVELAVDFRASDPNAKLYMYGLETIVYPDVLMNEQGEAYIHPNKGEVILFSKAYYPLIPGTYQIRVECDQEVYYAPYRIKPKQLTTEQLNRMREQLEQTIRGLALDFISRSYSLGDHRGKSLPPKLLMKFMIIMKHFTNVMTSLSDLYTKVNYRTRKEYEVVRAERANAMDEVTVRHRLKHPELQGFLKVPVRTMDYDLPENRWLKHIIKHLITVLNDFLISVELYSSNLEQEIANISGYGHQESNHIVLNEKNKVQAELNEYVELVRSMKVGLQLITSAHWYEQVEERALQAIPYVLTKDSRYRTIYMLYRELQQEERQLTLDPFSTCQWKRTDKLYEMWGYVELLHMLVQDLNFKPISGWLYNQEFDEDKLLIPSLPEGERIVLERGDLRLHLIYDGVVPLSSCETSLYDQPLYMRQGHNRPDGRLDMYYKDMYCGTIMIDFKYRPRHNFWRKSSVNTIVRTREMQQLIGYSDSRSSMLYGLDKNHPAARQLSPVLEVWAFYPVKPDRAEAPATSEDHNLWLLPLSPDASHVHVIGAFERVLKQAVSQYDRFHRDLFLNGIGMW